MNGTDRKEPYDLSDRRGGGGRENGFRRRFLFRILLPLIFWLSVWELASRAAGKEVILPSPERVFIRLLQLMGQASFYRAASASLLRVAAGILAGALLGFLAALLTERFREADLLLSPMIRVIRTVPVASFILLLLLWFRKGTVPAVISGLMSLPLIWESSSAGLRAPDPLLLEMCAAYDLPRGRVWKLVRLPALMPHFLSGLSDAVGLSFKAGIAAEVLCIPLRAIGTSMYQSKIYLETPDLFAWTLVVVVLSLILEKVLRSAVRRLSKKWNCNF